MRHPPHQDKWIARRAENGIELARARWWLVPFWHRGGLKDFKLTTFNAKADRRQRSDLSRIVQASPLSGAGVVLV
jgi:putative SOS response-associated peptidase YedK